MSKKIVILHKSGEKAAAGIVKIVGDEKGAKAYVSVEQLSSPCLFLLKAGKKYTSTLTDRKQTIDLSGYDGGPADCAITDRSGRTLLYYGSSEGNTVGSFALFEEYKKRAEKPGDRAARPSSPPVGDRAEEHKISAASRESSSSASSASAGEKATFELDGGLIYEGENFYSAVKPQLDEMFVCYPEEKVLNDVIPNSRWIRVNCEEGFYVVGILYNLEEPIYICYGIKGVYTLRPPEELGAVCDWLPLDLNNKFGDGYWVIYQDAKTGKTVRRPQNGV